MCIRDRRKYSASWHMQYNISTEGDSIPWTGVCRQASVPASAASCGHQPCCRSASHLWEPAPRSSAGLGSLASTSLSSREKYASACRQHAVWVLKHSDSWHLPSSLPVARCISHGQRLFDIGKGEMEHQARKTKQAGNLRAATFTEMCTITTAPSRMSFPTIVEIL